MSEYESLPYQDSVDDFIGIGSYRVLQTFDENATGEYEPLQRDIRGKVQRALFDFPELAGETVTIARLDPDDAEDGTHGRAGMLNRIVYLPTTRGTTFVTMYHELAHLAIQIRDERGDDVPTTSEEYCSLLGMSRMPPRLIDESRIPYLGQPAIARDRWPDVCSLALDYRENHHAYIQQAKAWLRGEEPVEPDSGNW